MLMFSLKVTSILFVCIYHKKGDIQGMIDDNIDFCYCESCHYEFFLYDCSEEISCITENKILNFNVSC